jgi:16S rRNA processing protein RimM
MCVISAFHLLYFSPYSQRKTRMMLPAPEWVLLARIVRPQGRHGELLADIFTDFPQHFADRKGLFLRPPAGAPSAAMSEVTVDAHWLHKGRVVLKFSHVHSINDAEKLRGFEVVVSPQERMPLEGDAVYVSDLAGCHVIDVSHGAVDAGEIIDVEPEGAGPAMLVIRSPSGEELLIPFVRAYLRRVDIEAKRVEMELPEGLLTLQAPAQANESESA